MKLTDLGKEQIGKSQIGGAEATLVGYPGVRVSGVYGQEVWLQACLFDEAGQMLAVLDDKRCSIKDVVRLGSTIVLPVKFEDYKRPSIRL